jgi:hypothetical protein
MPIFISYSQKDTRFVDTLVRNLVAAKHHVWMDRWELSLGDSLTKKIESALTESGAMLVVLSKNSVDSEWCKRVADPSLIFYSEVPPPIWGPTVPTIEQQKANFRIWSEPWKYRACRRLGTAINQCSDGD